MKPSTRAKEMLKEQREVTVVCLLEFFKKNHVAMSCLEDEGPITIRLDERTREPQIEFTETIVSSEIPNPIKR